MPRFGLKSLLIVFTGMALWLSTFAQYVGAEEVRSFIMVSVLVTSGVAALSYTARRRAFWLGFFGTMLALATRGVFAGFGSRFQWARELSMEWEHYFSVVPAKRGRLVLGINLTLIFVAMLVMATLIGLMCVHVYDKATRRENNDSPR